MMSEEEREQWETITLGLSERRMERWACLGALAGIGTFLVLAWWLIATLAVLLVETVAP